MESSTSFSEIMRLFSEIAGLASFISVVLGIINHISKYANDFRSKRKPHFFVYELLLIKFCYEEKKKEYQIKGRLVNNNDFKFESIKVSFISSNHYWNGAGNCYRCINGKKKNDNGITSTIEKNFDDNDGTLEWKSEDPNNLNINRDHSYEIEGKYVVKDESTNEKNKKDENYEYKDYKYKEEDITKSLEITATVKGKDEKGKDITKDLILNPIKCPNIKTWWLSIYICISTLAIFIGVISTLMLIYSWKGLNDDIVGLKPVFIIYGVLIFLITVYFFVVNIKCVSQLIVLIRMKKFDVPAKLNSNKISNKTLIPKTIEFMTGTEKVDNIDKILLV